jgi:hypothetical protein
MPKEPQGRQPAADVIGAGAICGGLAAARVGQAFYWIACGIAALITLFLMSGPEIERPAAIMMMGAGGASWLIGRACRYLLAGR